MLAKYSPDFPDILKSPMPTKIETFSARPRKRRYNYDEWLTGELFRLDALEDFVGKPKNVADSITSYARRHGFAAVALPARGPDGQLSSVEVWGDPSVPWSDGPPREIRERIEAGGFRIRR